MRCPAQSCAEATVSAGARSAQRETSRESSAAL
jgi:hypothetical protein